MDTKGMFKEFSRLHENLYKYDELIRTTNQIKKYEKELLYGKHTYNALLNMFNYDDVAFGMIVDKFKENKNEIMSDIRSLEGMLQDIKKFVDKI